MSLREELKGIEGKKRKFLLLRIVGTDAETSRKLCHIPKGTYHNWLHHSDFTEVYQRVKDLSVDYKQEAIQLLRRTTQLQAALLEEQIIEKMKEEIASGNYSLIKTLLARSVYDKIINSLDYQPEHLTMSWEQKLQNIYNQPQIEGVVNGTETRLIEETCVKPAEYSEGEFVEVGKQESQQAGEEAQVGELGTSKDMISDYKE